MGAMDGLLTGSVSSAQEVRRASAPPTTSSANSGGGFSSIFNLKSVISAATKNAPSTQPSTSSSTNFYVSSSPVAPETVNMHLQSQTAAPQKSVQGIVSQQMQAAVTRPVYFVLLSWRPFLFVFMFSFFWWNIVLINSEKELENPLHNAVDWHFGWCWINRNRR